MIRRRTLHTISSRRRPTNRQRTTWRTVGEYFVGAVFVGGAAGLGLTVFDNYQAELAARRAILDTLPAGYEFPGCNEVRSRGLAPLYRGERGFSDRLDGDGDGIGCEPYP